ncbi:UDP-N-acetyl-D-mannosamine dehydrogenase [bacterium F11]|nr:UDP-N-acetyl-D-mannosamine dehydrogenase [bacterium F11]
MGSKKEKICVLGLGYIGLPTATLFATNGHKVYGVDNNADVINTLKAGEIHIEEPGLSTVVKAALSSGNLQLGTTPAPADVFVVAVPTPSISVENEKIPKADMSFVEKAIESILPHLKKGNLIILESTSPPGTTRDLVIPLVKKVGFLPVTDIGVAYCPERVIPGQALKELIENDRIVGAIDQTWAEKTKALYKSFVSGNIFLTDPTVAEMVKLLENTFRDVNIALANEISVVCQKLGISVWEVIELANRHPRVNVHRPGPGVGGHCISVDPWFIVEKFPSDAKLVQTARGVNDQMPSKVVEIIGSLIEGIEKPKLAILGLAYKGDVDDIRESPAIQIIEQLKTKHPKLTFSIYEPHVKSGPYPLSNLKDTFQDADMAILLTPHKEYLSLNPDEIAPLMRRKMFFDTHNKLKSERWVPYGFEFIVLGTDFSKVPIKGKTS